MPPSSLRDLLEGNDLPATVEALRQAVETRDTGALEDLERRLARPAPEELQAALLLALGQLGGPATEPRVRGFTRHPSPRVRQAAETALRRLTSPESLLARLGAERRQPPTAVPTAPPVAAEPAPRPSPASVEATPATGSPLRWEKFLSPPPPAAPAPQATARRPPRAASKPAGPPPETERPKPPPMRRCPVCGESCPRKLTACPSCHEKF
jgi:hypothetical protein